MKRPLFIVYHLYQTERWEQLFAEQIGLLFSSQLIPEAHLYLSVTGTEVVPKLPNCTVVERWKNDMEKPSLLLAQQIAKDNPDACILYMHSKGISHPSVNQDDWRMMLQHFLIVNWKLAISYLNEYDMASANWRTYPVPHPSGNYWWANASYLARLDPQYMENESRWHQEFWTGTMAPKVANLHESLTEHYGNPYPPSSYCSDYFAARKKETHQLSYGSRIDAINEGLIQPVFNVDYF